MDEHQNRVLEQLFNQTSKPSAPQREAVAKTLGLPLRAVQTWLSDRRTKAKADKKLEELQTRAALENAHQISSRENMALPLNHNANHRTQSEASYASLARSLAAAAACMPQPDVLYEHSLPPSPVFHLNMGFPMYSPTNSSFDTSTSMLRSDSQYSNFSTTTNGEMQEQTNCPFFQDQSNYMPTPFAARNTMIYENLEAQSSSTNARTVRPGLQRTWTAPESEHSRSVPRRSIVSSVPRDISQATEPVRIRRRPKLSPLGVGMARSRSSLGYEQADYPYSARRATAPSEFHCPVTPVRRIASAAAIPTLATMRSFSSASQDSTGTTIDSGLGSSTSQDFISSSIQFPPSPISPDHAHSLTQSACKITSFDLQQFPITEDSFTPPATPLSAFTGSAENILASGGGYEDTWSSDFSKLSGLDTTNNDLIIADLFLDQEMGMATF